MHKNQVILAGGLIAFTLGLVTEVNQAANPLVVVSIAVGMLTILIALYRGTK